ncbi:hypothetical protein EHQ92_15145 [Leptospira biflexa]|jgi:hypothetical protein|uniref:Uncharacterized protein n=1 Tax=Leptospira biflexa serovar Patoc (strain Patoc 1 / ATCC 23582 / Paris) TaxID=456481 RepID=B0SU10_LEPBP|nr:hypothetical protein [Leptospira biflexa]ABZ95977.1 Hypothetical protein LBF_4155 [Leptospira biflexa serovar Patoc strain 'Patoc 1 (Ames)']ABZ99694.1 Hypothetical protein LEPBI_II0159 [Leptospira biflexa serovar Patoc strain 'Patoc 1 (Paris)']TGM32174.1 hypothetical protein EHQ80_17935 [Leptospira biflexa]TGM42152.1 hypothetical protein EHQ89_01165 [Leptospira biflexa]TGM42674.1 hypothetical protein EHQ92_15145 [Leptospira biflexa]
MIFTKREIEEHYPLSERLRLEKAKSQNSVIYWINELVRNQVRGAEDVTSLIEVTKDLVMQVEDLYAEKENSVANPSGQSSNSIELDSIEEQISDLYAEKESLFEQTKTSSISEVIALIKGMEEQLNSMYSEYET